MSIYATIGVIIMPTGRQTTEAQCKGEYHIDRQSGGQVVTGAGTYAATTYDEYVEVWYQAVPPHIGHPRDYPDGDPYGDFLPPLPPDIDPDDWTRYRAVVVCGPNTKKGTRTNGQQYVNPLLVLSGDEWNTIPFRELWRRIETAFETHWTRRRPRRKGEPEYTMKMMNL